MIFVNSRYERMEKVSVLTSDGEERRRVVEMPYYYPTQFSARKHIVRQDERMDTLAARYYGDPESWWRIAAANPEVFFPENVPPGTVLRIPDAPSLL